jgi:hypothetical protein
MRTCSDGRLRLNRKRSKDDLATWLITMLRNTCHSLCNRSFSRPQELIPVRFSSCSSPGSLDNIDQMITVFNSEFSEAFMLIVFPLDAHPNVRCKEKIDTDWPQLVADKIKKKCAALYRDATTISTPPTCCVCARACRKARMKSCSIHDNCRSLPLGLERLRLTNPHIIGKIASNNPFIFGHHLLNDLMLAQQGVVRDENKSSFSLLICESCHSSLTHNSYSIPKHLLKNNLYRGFLPERFHSLTWIEEQVCAIYQSTAFVTRLHFLNDPKQPYILHGNTCAFEQDVVSTANILPRAPADMEGCLSVIFTGPKCEIAQAALKNIFRI